MQPGNHFEATNYALRKNRDGVVVSFVVRPSDVDAALTSLPIGARVMIGWCEIGDDEQRKDGEANSTIDSVQSGPRLHKTPPQAEPVATPGARSKRKFSELSLPQQAGIRCGDFKFRTFLAMREQITGVLAVDLDMAEDIVRDRCGVASRSELSHNHDAANNWRKLDAEYERWLTTQTYADSIR